MTLKHYQDFSLLDLWAEIGKLPPIRTAAEAVEEARATGTDDARIVVRPVAIHNGRKGVKLAANDRKGDKAMGPLVISRRPYKNRGFRHEKHG